MAVCGTCGSEHVSYLPDKSPCIGHRTHELVDGVRTKLPAPLPCRKLPMKGQNRCSSHGGQTPRIKAAAARKMAEAKAVQLAARWGVAIVTSPTEAILGQVNVWSGLALFYSEQVEKLTNAQLIWGKAREKTGGEDYGTTYEAGPSVWITLHEQASRNLVKFAAEAIKAGIEERKVRLAEQQGALVADVIKRILTDLDLSPAQQARVPEIVPRQLRSIIGGAA